ncbi:MAG: cystathionine beta-lyase [Gammaproteobacteria bacterium]|jgi:cystathionine beta-lyase
MHIDTKVARFDAAPGDPYRPTSTPIYQTATFGQASASEFGEYDYSRSGNPTRTVLEAKLADLEGGQSGFALASGMAALSVLLRSVLALSAGPDTRAGWLLVGADLYGGTTRLIEKLVAPLGVEVRSVDTTDLVATSAALTELRSRPGPGLVLLETPSNPLLRVTDLGAIARLVKEAGALLAVDNTALSPYFQRPLEHGADIVVHSGTKHLGGHGDVTAGVLVTSNKVVAGGIAFLQNAEGIALGPFESWLLLRGIKTLGVRVAQEARNAQEVALFLAQKIGSKNVFYPGLESHPGHFLQKSQASGFGQLISFRAGDATSAKTICEATRLFTIAVSFGSTNSTISMPCRMSHASVPGAAIAAGRVAALPEDLVRLSIGLENPRDLIRDLEAAMNDLPVVVGEFGSHELRAVRPNT